MWNMKERNNWPDDGVERRSTLTSPSQWCCLVALAMYHPLRVELPPNDLQATNLTTLRANWPGRQNQSPTSKNPPPGPPSLSIEASRSSSTNSVNSSSRLRSYVAETRVGPNEPPPSAEMVVKIRLARFGRRNSPFYNIVVAQARYAFLSSTAFAPDSQAPLEAFITPLV